MSTRVSTRVSNRVSTSVSASVGTRVSTRVSTTMSTSMSTTVSTTASTGGQFLLIGLDGGMRGSCDMKDGAGTPSALILGDETNFIHAVQ